MYYNRLDKMSLGRIKQRTGPKARNDGAPSSYRKAKETHELIFSWLSWLAVFACGRENMTATATIESRKMVVILQLIGQQRHAALVYSIL